MSFQELAIEFQALSNDVERWKWVVARKDVLHVECDNDWVGAYFDGDDSEDAITLCFDHFIGCGQGQMDLFSAIGVKASCV